MAAREAVTLGGSVCVPLRDIPGVGRFCGLTSPQGVTFYAIEYAHAVRAAFEVAETSANVKS